MGKRILRNFVVFNFLDSFFSAACHAIIVLFWLKIGLTMSEIAFLNGAYFVACFVFEFPTGVIADLFGRRISILFGLLICAVAYLFYGFSFCFWSCLTAEMTLAFGQSFISGALDAWLKDSLDYYQHKGNLTKNFSLGEIALRLASGLSGFFGAYLGLIDYHLAFLFSALGLGFLALLSLFMLSENYFVKSDLTLQKSFKKIIVDSWRFGCQKKIVWRIILSMSFMAMACQALNLQWSLVLADKLGPEIIGPAWIGVKLFEFFGLLVVYFLIEKKFIGAQLLQFANLLIVFCLLPMIYFDNGWFILLFFLLQEIGRGIFAPTRKALLQENIPGQVRATIGSFAEMIMKIFMAVGWFCFAVLSDYFSYKIVWLCSLPILFLAVFFCRKIKTLPKI